MGTPLKGALDGIKGTSSNAECHTSLQLRPAPLVIEPNLREDVIARLRDGLSTQQILDLNYNSVQKAPVHMIQGNKRSVLSALDINNIRRTIRQQDLRIDLRLSAEENLDMMFNPEIATDAEFTEACFHYQARSVESARFELGIATPAMKEAAWKYAHNRMVLLDGTFGVSIQKILLFVLLEIDNNKIGVPIGMLHFSAPPGNRQTSAGYDARILERMLRSWKTSLESMRPGTPFYIRLSMI